MIHIAERRALDGADASEWLRAADLSLVAPAPPSPQLLRLFLAALADPPPGELCYICVDIIGYLNGIALNKYMLVITYVSGMQYKPHYSNT